MMGGMVILSRLLCRRAKGGKLAGQQLLQVPVGICHHVHLLQANPPSHPGQPATVISTDTLSPQPCREPPEGNAGMIFIFSFILYFHVVFNIGLVDNGQIVMFTD